MKRMRIIVICLMLNGCVSTPPWRGFLNTGAQRWEAYLDEPIAVDYTNRPLSEVLTEPEFPNFNVIIQFGHGTVDVAEGDDPFENVSEEPEPSRVTMSAHAMTRREILWRIAKQCDLDMSVGRDENGNPRCVVILPRKGAEQSPAGDSLKAAPEE